MYGSYRPLLEDSPSIWAYERELDGQVITVGCNWTDTEQPCDLWDDDGGEPLVCNYEEHAPGILKPYECYVTVR